MVGQPRVSEIRPGGARAGGGGRVAVWVVVEVVRSQPAAGRDHVARGSTPPEGRGVTDARVGALMGSVGPSAPGAELSAARFFTR